MPVTTASKGILHVSSGPVGPPIGEEALHDLGLDRVLSSLPVDARVAAALRTPLPDAGAVRYRQDVFRDLEDDRTRETLTRLAAATGRASAHRAASGRIRQQALRNRLHLGAVLEYLRAIDDGASGLDDAGSEAVGALREHLRALAGSEPVAVMSTRADRLEARWRRVRFTLVLQAGRVVVAPFGDEPDLEQELEEVLRPFGRSETVADPPSPTRSGLLGDSLGSVSEWILDAVSSLEPDLFAELAAFQHDHEDFVDPALERFATELPFYLEMRGITGRLRDAGVPIVLPAVRETDRCIELRAFVDLALAVRLSAEGGAPVGNDLSLRTGERILVVTGPNQGGKSTTARAIGQLLHLASIGCPVPASHATVPLIDRVLTLFPREERLETHAGGLGEEIERTHRLLGIATERSLLVLNEVFASTTAADARLLLAEVVRRIDASGALAVLVTFLDEIAELGGPVVSGVVEVDPDDVGIRTFRLTRRPADGRAYADALAARHGLTASAIHARLQGGGR